MSISLFSAWTALACIAWLILFHVALALGAPLGHLAWGGRQRVLSPSFRAGSVASAIVLAFGAACVAERAGIADVVGSEAVAQVGVWGLVTLFALSTVGNLATESVVERRHGVPVSVMLAAASAIVAFA
ncbi:MAG: hypothetical protein Rubg2KO_21800 [Rubricoccaceae bacterium]